MATVPELRRAGGSTGLGGGGLRGAGFGGAALRGNHSVSHPPDKHRTTSSTALYLLGLDGVPLALRIGTGDSNVVTDDWCVSNCNHVDVGCTLPQLDPFREQSSAGCDPTSSRLEGAHRFLVAVPPNGAPFVLQPLNNSKLREPSQPPLQCRRSTSLNLRAP